MDRARWTGVAFIALGAAFVAIAYRAEPPRTLSVLAGVLFVIAGVLRILRARRP